MTAPTISPSERLDLPTALRLDRAPTGPETVPGRHPDPPPAPDPGLDPDGWQQLIARQHGAVSRAQLRAQGITAGGIAANLSAGRWQRALVGVYVVFTGPLPEGTRFWIALLRCGRPAALSHQTAGRLWGILPDPGRAPIHVTVPATRNPRSRRGIVVHRAAIMPPTGGSPPRTTVAATATALCAEALDADDAVAIIARVAQRYPEALAPLRSQLGARSGMPRRRTLLDTLDAAAEGAHSALEQLYLRHVERAHGLPQGIRQRQVNSTAQDVHYRDQAVTVELDGRLGHDDTDGRWRDMDRDNAAAARGEITLRYGWHDVRTRPCQVAAQVAAALTAQRWNGRVRPCGPDCGAINDHPG
jgi:very-short-patch-repair endonuclease